MKEYFRKNFPEKMSYDALRAAVKEAREAIPESWLRELAMGMQQRMWDIYDANGMHTKP